MTSTWEITNGSVEVQGSSSPGTSLLTALASGHFWSSTISVRDCANASCTLSLGESASVSHSDKGARLGYLTCCPKLSSIRCLVRRSTMGILGPRRLHDCDDNMVPGLASHYSHGYLLGVRNCGRRTCPLLFSFAAQSFRAFK